jgi:REP element-mobilizing transposase RayT
MPPNRPKYSRLPNYDYSGPGTYSVTLCICNREPLLSTIVEGQVVLTRIGEMVQEEWLRSFEIRAELELDSYIIMPDHMHGIVRIVEEDRVKQRALQEAQLGPPEKFVRHRARSLGAFIGQFKAITAKRVNELRATPSQRLWQPDYFERVIRDEQELYEHRKYILNNPYRWQNRNRAS